MAEMEQKEGKIFQISNALIFLNPFLTETKNINCPLVCQNGGICLRLGTAPGHLECLCPSNFAGPLCQCLQFPPSKLIQFNNFTFSVPSTLSAPILPGLILFSLLLFVLAILLIFCHGSASSGFFLQMGRKGAKGRRKDIRKWPLLELEEENGEEMDCGDDLEMRQIQIEFIFNPPTFSGNAVHLHQHFFHPILPNHQWLWPLHFPSKIPFKFKKTKLLDLANSKMIPKLCTFNINKCSTFSSFL